MRLAGSTGQGISADSPPALRHKYVEGTVSALRPYCDLLPAASNCLRKAIRSFTFCSSFRPA